MGLGDFVGSIIEAGSDLIGLDKQRRENTRQREQDQRNADEANRLSQEQFERNIALQKEFAQQGVRWKIEDAKAAGIHPLAALGAVGPSYSPSSSVFTSPSHSADTTTAGKWRSAGQNISRAIAATQTKEERVRDALATERMQLENELLKAQITNAAKGPLGPPFPGSGRFDEIEGQGADAPVAHVPARRVMSPRGAPYQEAGDRPDLSFSRTKSGRVPVIPEGLSESMEDDMIGRIMWRIRNQLVNNLGFGSPPAESELPKGARGWKWNVLNQEWQPDYGKFDLFSITPWKNIKRNMRRQ